MKIKTIFWSDGKAVGEAVNISRLTVKVDSNDLECFYFPRVTLYPATFIFHLSGLALSGTFDRCKIQIQTDPIEDISNLRYVHGRIEKLPGNPQVHSVLLAKDASIPQQKWLPMLPAIYKAVIKNLD